MDNERRLTRKRRLIQLYSALLYNARLKGFVSGGLYAGKSKALCVPGLNCYSCPGAVASCPLGALQNAMAASSAGGVAYAAGILLLSGVLLGRTVCGWLCPFGLIQELLYKIPGPKIRKSRVTRVLSFGKYLMLALVVLFLSAELALPAFCKYVCPAGTLEGALLNLTTRRGAEIAALLGSAFARKLAVLIAVLLAAVFLYRGFCRFLCPLGAVYALLGRLSPVGVKTDGSRCTDCGACVTACPADIRRVGDAECVQCGACVDRCPEKAISFRAGKWVLYGGEAGQTPAEKAPEKRRTLRAVLCVLAAAALAAALAFANLPEKEAPPVTSENTGWDIGQYPADFTVPMYGGGEFTLSACRGRVTVLNFWATYCAPCLEEMPGFARLAAEYPDDLAMALLHVQMTVEDVPAFLETLPAGLPYGWDEHGAAAEALGGASILPATVVLDRNGAVYFTGSGEVPFEELEMMIRSLLQKGR